MDINNGKQHKIKKFVGKSKPFRKTIKKLTVHGYLTLYNKFYTLSSSSSHMIFVKSLFSIIFLKKMSNKEIFISK